MIFKFSCLISIALLVVTISVWTVTSDMHGQPYGKRIKTTVARSIVYFKNFASDVSKEAESIEKKSLTQ